MAVLLTVPHGGPVASDESNPHPQDFIAQEMAQYIRQYFRAPDKIDLIVSEKSRFGPDYCDMNRYSSYSESRLDCEGEFTEKLETWIGKHVKHAGSFVLDVHSYPNDHSEIGEGRDCYVLHNDLGDRALPHVDSFQMRLHSAGINCGVFKGGRVNYIHAAAERAGIPSLIVEFNEQMTTSRKHSVARVVAEWLFSYIQTRT